MIFSASLEMIKNPEIDPMYKVQWFLKREKRQFNRERIVSSTNDAGKIGYTCTSNINLIYTLYHIGKWTQNELYSQINTFSSKTPELCKEFLDTKWKTLFVDIKHDELYFIMNKNFCSSKETLERINIQAIDGEKYLQTKYFKVC